MKSIYHLDFFFTVEEFGASTTRQKKRKAPVLDNLTGEHLLEGRDVVNWLAATAILNAVVNLEAVPVSVKCGGVVPVYKGSRNNLMKVGSYRGVILSSVIAKLLEFLVLVRPEVVFLEANIPHSNESAY